VLFALGYLLKTLVDYFTGEEKQFYHIISSLIGILMLPVWAVIRWRWPLLAPKVIYGFALLQCIKINLGIRDQLP
jgi:hypothetical protein